MCGFCVVLVAAGNDPKHMSTCTLRRSVPLSEECETLAIFIAVLWWGVQNVRFNMILNELPTDPNPVFCGESSGCSTFDDTGLLVWIEYKSAHYVVRC